MATGLAVTGATTLGAAAARRAAAAILGEGRFHTGRVPRPLHSLLHALGSFLAAPFDAIGQLAADLGAVLPGGAVTGWSVLGVLLATATLLITRRYTRRALASDARRELSETDGVDAAALDREAAEAERAGRYGDAVRLRFRAGLERLRERGVIRSSRAPTRELAAAVGSERFDALARRFDEIVYGGTPATSVDAREAGEGWRSVTREATPP